MNQIFRNKVQVDELRFSLLCKKNISLLKQKSSSRSSSRFLEKKGGKPRPVSLDLLQKVWVFFVVYVDGFSVWTHFLSLRLIL